MKRLLRSSRRSARVGMPVLSRASLYRSSLAEGSQGSPLKALQFISQRPGECAVPNRARILQQLPYQWLVNAHIWPHSTPARCSRRRKYSLWEALLWLSSICASQVKSLLKVTPSSLTVLTRSTDLPLMVIGGISGFELAKETRGSFVLSQFTDIRLSFDHWTASVAARWRRLSVASAEHTSHSVLSSTYLKVGRHVCMALMWMTNPTGPNRVPWRTPTLMVHQSET